MLRYGVTFEHEYNYCGNVACHARVEELPDGDYVLYSDHEAAIAVKNEMLWKKENKIVECRAIIESISLLVTEGVEPSDFMMSFIPVREVWDVVQNVAVKDKRIAELEAGRVVIGSDIYACPKPVRNHVDRLTAERDRLREALEDWLNFSSDVYTSDFPGMEWLINLQKKTSELIAQAAIERGKQ